MDNNEKIERLDHIMSMKNINSLYHYEYLAAANDFINMNGKWTGPSADVEVSKRMLSYEYDPRMVGQVIKDLSPEVAGLNIKDQENYIEDIITQAQNGKKYAVEETKIENVNVLKVKEVLQDQRDSIEQKMLWSKSPTVSSPGSEVNQMFETLRNSNGKSELLTYSEKDILTNPHAKDLHDGILQDKQYREAFLPQFNEVNGMLKDVSQLGMADKDANLIIERPIFDSDLDVKNLLWQKENIQAQVNEQVNTKVRVKEIINYDVSMERGISKDYHVQAKELIFQKGWARNDADVEISQKLLQAGRTKLQVHEAIKKLSPEVTGKSSIEASQYAKTILAKAITPEIQKTISKAKGIER